MREAVKAIEKDSKGNFWYLTNFFSPSGKIRNDYDLTLDQDKAGSLLVCTPFSTVINKVGSLFANGRIYVPWKIRKKMWSIC